VWNRSRRLPRLGRSAPVGIRPASRPDAPADGWEILNPTVGDQLTAVVDHVAIGAADSVARAVSRRTFLGGVAKAGLLIGSGMISVLWRVSEAEAIESCNHDDPNNAVQGPCGPSPLCQSEHCIGGGQCNLGHTNIRRRAYSGDTCASADAQNCWVENCCASSGAHWRCCDCCQDHGASAQNCGCPNRRKCLCRERLEDTC
jgi:hypothetical protein